MTRSSGLSDDSLLGRMIAGDEDAFALLYRRTHAAIYRFALHMCGNTAIAEDVTQEVFMALIRDARRYDPQKGTVSGFLFGIARNHLRKRWERERRLVPLAELAGEFDTPGENGSGDPTRTLSVSVHDDLAAFETVARVRQAIATLPANYREVVILCDLEEMSYEEAASALACPVGTVRSRLHRAREILIEKLRDVNPMRRAPAVGA